MSSEQDSGWGSLPNHEKACPLAQAIFLAKTELSGAAVGNVCYEWSSRNNVSELSCKEDARGLDLEGPLGGVTASKRLRRSVGRAIAEERDAVVRAIDDCQMNQFIGFARLRRSICASDALESVATYHPLPGLLLGKDYGVEHGSICGFNAKRASESLGLPLSQGFGWLLLKSPPQAVLIDHFFHSKTLRFDLVSWDRGHMRLAPSSTQSSQHPRAEHVLNARRVGTGVTSMDTPSPTRRGVPRWLETGRRKPTGPGG